MDPGGFNDVIRFERDASGLPKGLYRGSDEFSGSALDGTDGTQSELCARRFSQRLPIPIARPGYQVLPQFYEDSRGGRNQGCEIAGAQSQFERAFGKVAQVDQRGVLVENFFFSSRRRHTRLQGDWSSDVCSSD